MTALLSSHVLPLGDRGWCGSGQQNGFCFYSQWPAPPTLHFGLIPFSRWPLAHVGGHFSSIVKGSRPHSWVTKAGFETLKSQMWLAGEDSARSPRSQRDSVSPTKMAVLSSETHFLFFHCLSSKPLEEQEWPGPSPEDLQLPGPTYPTFKLPQQLDLALDLKTHQSLGFP